MSETLAQQLERTSKAPKSILRFSRAEVGRCRSGYPIAGYVWQSVKTDSEGVAEFLRLCWNNRETIIAALAQRTNDHD